MIKIILSGCNGKMGRVITECASGREDLMIVAGIDVNPAMDGGYPVFTKATQCDVSADIILDFSHPSALDTLLDTAVNKNIPAVIATTGFNQEQVARIGAASRHIPIFFTANMSMGVNLLIELSKIAAGFLGGDFDIEIIEKHHNQKVDAPSGTALMLADAMGEVMAQKPVYVYDRHSQRGKRSKNEIGIHAVRGGTITGEHDVIFAGRDEVLTISHTAASKSVFAVGCLNAALFLAGKPAGLYGMRDMLFLKAD